MAFIPNTAAYSGRLCRVSFGTGEDAITLGGQNVLPFYSFDAPIPNTPKIGVEICDSMVGWDAPGLQGFYQGCDTMAQRARRAAELESVDFLCLNFASADPGGVNRAVEDCVADAVAVAEAVRLPLAVMGCRNMEKDGLLFTQLAKALRGRRALFLSARIEDYKQLADTVVLENGHILCAETADDINLAKQLNIMLKGMDVPAESIVMNIGTAAVGYGYDYVASTLDRIRLAALEQGDADLQLPIVAPVSCDTWCVKESVATEEDAPEWGDREQRGIGMEISTAVADLSCGADAVILRHPEAIRTVREFIRQLT